MNSRVSTENLYGVSLRTPNFKFAVIVKLGQVLLITLVAINYWSCDPSKPDHPIEGRPEGAIDPPNYIVKFDTVRARCGIKSSIENKHSVECNAVVIDGNGNERLADGISKQVTLEWQQPTPLEGVGIVTDIRCGQPNQALLFLCEITLQNSSPAKVRFDLKVKEIEKSLEKMESDVVWVPFSVQSYGLVPQLLSYQNLAESGNSIDASADGKFATHENKISKKMGFQVKSFPASEAQLGAIHSLCWMAERLYFSAGTDKGEFIFRTDLKNSQVEIFAGSLNCENANEFSHRLRVSFSSPCTLETPPPSLPVQIACGKTELALTDPLRHRILKIHESGAVSLVAGMGSPGFSGDGGPATKAKLNNPQGLTVGTDGALYVSDTQNHRIRKIEPSGIISTVTGTGTAGFSGDGGQARQAQINKPQSILITSNDRILFVDSGNLRIREILATGTIRTIMGTGVFSASTLTGIPASSASVSSDSTIAIPQNSQDSSGAIDLRIADQNFSMVRKVNSDGTVSTLAGMGAFGSTTSPIEGPTSMVLLDDNSLTIGTLGRRIHKIDSAGVITTVVGTIARPEIEGVPVQWAQLLFSDVVGIAAGGGAIYFSEPLLNQVRKIDQDGKIKTVAGKGTSGFAPNGWDALAAPLQRPTALAFGPEGSLYIANTADPVLGGGHHINRVDTAGLIWVAAGTGGPGFSGDGGLATNAQLARPNDIAIAPDGAIFIADTGNKRIRKVTTDGIIRTVAGVNNPWISACSETNVPATNTNLCGPTGVAVGPATSDEFYIADNGVRPLVRKVSTDGNIRTLAGGGGSFPPFEGSHPARQVRFGRLTRLAVGLEGHIYVLDAYLRRIFLLTPNTAGTEYWISTYFGGKQDNKDCGGGLLEGISTLENLDVRLRATLSTMCAGHPTAISISHSCGEPKGVVNIFFSQVFGQHWAGNIIHVTRPCSQ